MAVSPGEINTDDISQEVSAAYIAYDNTFKHVRQSSVSRTIAIEIGDAKQPSLTYPQFKTKHWDNECNFSVRLVDDDYENATIKTNASAIEWSRAGRIARFYDKNTGDENGGFEFEVEFASKPASNIVEFTIQTKGLTFTKQPDGTSVPGSYAVYHQEKTGNFVGGKHYRTGKAFHIYKPHAVDFEGVEVECALDINVVTGILSVTVPQNFIDDAVYPIIVDPTFGYTSIGASNATAAADAISGIGDLPASSGDVDSISFYARAASGTADIITALYDSGGTDNPTDYIDETAEKTGITTTAAWHTLNFSTPPAVAASTEYYICYAENADITFYYDVVASSAFFKLSAMTYPTWPSEIIGETGSNARRSIYATYTAAGGTTVNATTAGITTATFQAGVNAKKAITSTAAAISSATYQATITQGADTDISATTAAITTATYQASVNAKKAITSTTAAISSATYQATIVTGLNITALTAAITTATYAATVTNVIDWNITATTATMSLTPYQASVTAGVSVWTEQTKDTTGWTELTADTTNWTEQ